MFLKPRNQVVVDGIQVILVRGGGKVRLLKLDPFIQVGDDVGGHLPGVLLDPEEAALFIGLHARQELFGQLFMVEVFAVVPVNLVGFALMHPGYVEVSPILAEMD